MANPDYLSSLEKSLRRNGRRIAAAGMDLGTTKSCMAIASYDPDDGKLRCENVVYEGEGQSAGSPAVPSVVAIDGERTQIGHPARRRCGMRGAIPEKNLFRESKNEIGLRYTYARAPEGFRNAGDIASHLIGHLVEGAQLRERDCTPPLVITVPASFHAAQRHATLQAASRHAADGQVTLLDEPYAAFLDLLHRRPDKVRERAQSGCNWLVFDFGGGTCDVAIFTFHKSTGATTPRLLATSRYHRIGGGDIDRALVHQHLLPMLLKAHKLDPWSVSWRDKRRQLEPQLLPLAERLKIALCRREAANAGADAEVVAAGEFEIRLGDETLWLESPTLDSQTFRDVLKPFVDPQPPPENSDDYVQRGSIFLPISHAMLRAQLCAEDIDAVLLAGSSTRIPAVRKAIRDLFHNATLLEESDDAAVQGAIARGAALQALALAATGKPLIAPIACNRFSVRTRQGTLPLVEPGTPLPVCAEKSETLYAPGDAGSQDLELAVELLSDDRHLAGRSLWKLPPPVRRGEPLQLDWQMDENQCISLTLRRPHNPETESFAMRLDAPLSHIDPGQLVRVRMLEREQSIREDRIPAGDRGDAYLAIAHDASALGLHDKALHFLAIAMQELGASQYLLNLRGIYRQNVGDLDGAENSYRDCGEHPAAHFNLALLQYRQKRHAEALASLGEVDRHEHDRRHDAVLRGQILEGLGRDAEARVHFADAIDGVFDLEDFDDWSLPWLRTAASRLDRKDLVSSIDSERTQRARQERQGVRQGLLPDQMPQPDCTAS